MKFPAVVLVLVITIVEPPLVSREVGAAAQGRAMNLIGSVNGKTFFADNGLRNWQAAKGLCGQEGMRLAEIEASEEFDLLDSHYDAEIFDSWHWTAAKLICTYPNFSLNGASALASNSVFFTAQLVPDYCLTFDSIAGTGTSAWRGLPCDYTGGHTLCQTR